MRHNLLMAPLIVAMTSERIAEVVKHSEAMERTRDPQRLMVMPAVGEPEPPKVDLSRHPRDLYAKFEPIEIEMKSLFVDDGEIARLCQDFAPEPPPNRAQRREAERKRRRGRIGF